MVVQAGKGTLTLEEAPLSLLAAPITSLPSRFIYRQDSYNEQDQDARASVKHELESQLPKIGAGQSHLCRRIRNVANRLCVDQQENRRRDRQHKFQQDPVVPS